MKIQKTLVLLTIPFVALWGCGVQDSDQPAENSIVAGVKGEMPKLPLKKTTKSASTRKNP